MYEYKKQDVADLKTPVDWIARYQWQTCDQLKKLNTIGSAIEELLLASSAIEVKLTHKVADDPEFCLESDSTGCLKCNLILAMREMNRSLESIR